MSNDIATLPTLTLSDIVGIANVKFNKNFDGSPMAKITLKNGWMISLLAGSNFYASGDGSNFEVALVNPEGELDYCLSGDVWGYQTPDQVKAIILEAAALAPDAPRNTFGS